MGVKEFRPRIQRLGDRTDNLSTKEQDEREGIMMVDADIPLILCIGCKGSDLLYSVDITQPLSMQHSM